MKSLPTAPEEGAQAPAHVQEVVRSPGQPLDSATRARMEPRFGWDFSRVRVHSDAPAMQSAERLNAEAYTVGNRIVFGPGRFSPRTQDGQRLLAHELTHVVQQGNGAAALQRAPKRTAKQEAERAAILARAAQTAFTSYSDQLDAQLDAEEVLGLDRKRNTDKEYAWRLGRSDNARMQKNGTLTEDHQHEITVKIRFFDGEGKAAYLRTITATLSSLADAAQVPDLLAEPEIQPAAPSQEEAEGLGCDAGRKQFPLLYEGEPEKSTCMDITTDREFLENYFDSNIKSGEAYAVPGTTWENVEYRKFNALVVHYRNGNSEYFMLDEVGNFYFGGQALGLREFFFLKRKTTGLLYPIINGRLYSSEQLTPALISYKNGLKYQVKQMQELYTLLVTAGTFASIIGAYSAVEAFRASLEGFQIPRGAGGSKGAGAGGGGGEGQEPAGNVRVQEPEGEDLTSPKALPAQKQLSSSELKGTGKLTSDEVYPNWVKQGKAKAGQTMYEYKKASSDPSDRAEARMAERMTAEGYNVHFRANDKGGDLVVDGIVTDVKLPRSQNIQTAMGAAAQQGADQVIIDGSMVGLTDEQARAGIQAYETNAQKHPKLRSLETAFIVKADGTMLIYHRTTSLKKAN